MTFRDETTDVCVYVCVFVSNCDTAPNILFDIKMLIFVKFVSFIILIAIIIIATN